MFGFTRGNPCRSFACFHLQELSTQTSNVVQTSILSRDLLRSDTNHCQYRMLYKEKSSALFGRGIVLHAIRICESAARLQSIILGKVTREANPTSTIANKSKVFSRNSRRGGFALNSEFQINREIISFPEFIA